MTTAELVKRDDFKSHKQAAFQVLSKYYKEIDNVDYWYNKYLLALYENKLNPGFNNTDTDNNRTLFVKYCQDINAGYFIDKLFYEYNRGQINKMIFNPGRYAVEVTSTETGKTLADLTKEALGTTVKQTTAAAATVAEGAGDLISTIKNFLPLILIALAYLYFSTYRGK